MGRTQQSCGESTLDEIKNHRYDSFEDVDLAELRKNLEFEYLYRTHIPKYWVDKALELMESKRYDELEQLNYFDRMLKDAITCTEIGLDSEDW
jgi:hypothetical protein